MKKTLTALASGLILMGMTGMAHASLATIGTATYEGTAYDLIWDDDCNGKSLVWLDYSTARNPLTAQATWAAGLNTSGVLTYTLNPGYNLDFTNVTWRLPEVTNPNYEGFGYESTSSEMGHLFYTELGLTSQFFPGYTSAQLAAMTVFDHLVGDGFEGGYWTSTPASWVDMSYNFSFATGQRGHNSNDYSHRALAVSEANVSAVPIPGAVWLLGSGLMGMIGLRRKK